MQTIIKEYSVFQSLVPFMDHKLYQDFSLQALMADCPDYHIVIVENEPIAYCSVWYSNTVSGKNGEKIGAIGHFEAINEVGAKAVIEQACVLLKKHGCVAVVGPMNQNTWKKYRFVTESNGLPPFLLEPHNKMEYPNYFIGSDFYEYATYYSTIENPIMFHEEKCNTALSALKQEDIYIETFDMNRFDEQLDLIYELSLACFERNLFYTPLDKESFRQQYLVYKNYLIPELIFLFSIKTNQLVFSLAFLIIIKKLIKKELILYC